MTEEPDQIELPDADNVRRLINGCGKVFTGQKAADVYCVLVNLLGWTLAQSTNPAMQLMQTMQILAQHANVPFEHIDETTDDEEENDRPDKPLN